MIYKRSQKAYALSMLSAIYKDCNFAYVHYNPDNDHAEITRMDGGPTIEVDISNDLTVFETVARINNVMMQTFAEFPHEDCENYQELEDWVETEINELNIFEEVIPGIWRVEGSVYNGHPEDHHYWESFDDYIKVCEPRLAPR